MIGDRLTEINDHQDLSEYQLDCYCHLKRMSWIKLNVGGEMFETTRETLTKFPNSRLAEMVNSTFNSSKDDVLRLDLDPEYFRPVLNWLR